MIKSPQHRYLIHNPLPIVDAQDNTHNSHTDQQRPKPNGRLMQIALLLRSIEVPDHIVGQPVNPITSYLGHFGESFSFDLVVYGFDGEVDAWTA